MFSEMRRHDENPSLKSQGITTLVFERDKSGKNVYNQASSEEEAQILKDLQKAGALAGKEVMSNIEKKHVIHAAQRMTERNITPEMIADVLQYPQGIGKGKNHRQAVFEKGKLRVIFDVKTGFLISCMNITGKGWRDEVYTGTKGVHEKGTGERSG